MKSPASPEAEFSSSSEDMSEDFDVEEDIGGAIFDGTQWRCESCYQFLVDGVCPDGHSLQRCETCDWQLVDGFCPDCAETCDACGVNVIDGTCPVCASEEDSEEDDYIVHDSRDDVWRCIYCQWEVEAVNAIDGHCHCLIAAGEARYFDLSKCPDYEPADLCSSDDISSDGEADSEDEAFIDDGEIALEGAFDPIADMNGLAAFYAAGSENIEPKGLKLALEQAKAAAAERVNENQSPDPSPDDICTKSESVAEQSNIVDCESMDL